MSYKGLHTSRGLAVFRPDGTPLPMRLDLVNHSPTGFSCGYGGSGPAQLAFALLADIFDDDYALEHYQEFKWNVIAKLPRDKPWTLTVKQIRQAVKLPASAVPAMTNDKPVPLLPLRIGAPYGSLKTQIVNNDGHCVATVWTSRYQDSQAPVTVIIPYPEGQAYLRLIVRAVNAHDQLVAACQAARDSTHSTTCKRWTVESRVTDDDCNCHVAQARAVLAALEEA